MTTLALKDAYLSVPVHKDSKKFLQSLWRNKCYAFQGLCFGLNTAPRIFTKLLKPVAAFLRKRGVRMILYLDDFLILGSTYQEAQSHTAMAVSLLESLGFTVNLEKLCLIPTQIIIFQGFVIDSTVEAHEDRRSQIALQSGVQFCSSLIRCREALRENWNSFPEENLVKIVLT